MGSEDETQVLENIVIRTKTRRFAFNIAELLKQANEIYVLGHKNDAIQNYVNLEDVIWKMPKKGAKEYAVALECCASLMRMGHNPQEYEIMFKQYEEESIDNGVLTPQEIEKISYRQVKSKRFSLEL